MIRRRLSSSSASSLILDFLTNLRHSCWGHHHHRHRPRGCYSLMAACSYSLSSSLTITNNYNTDPYGLLFHSSSALKVRPCPKIVGIKSLSTNDNTNHNSNSYSRRPRALAPNVLVEQLKNCHDPIGFNKNGGYHTFGFPDPSVPEKVVVAVDVDEVLGNFVSALNRFIADRYSSDHSVSEYHVYEFFKIWNCSRDEADSRVHEFFKTSYFKTGIHPIPGARQALQKLSTFCNLSVVTSRQNAIKDHTIEWIEKHFPGLFQEIHFGNHFALEGQSRPKSEICRSLGAKVLIDDNPRYAAECAEAGIKVLLFDYENSYPWCKIESVAQHPLVVKVHNWEEVEHQLASHVVS